MTSEWHEVPLRELVGYISKGIAPSYAEEASETTIRVLNQKCNRNYRISYGDSRLHDTLKKKVPPERYIKPDDILINSTGAGTAGRIAQIEDVPSATTIDGHMTLIRSNGKVTQKFLGYALKAHQWEVLQLDEGSTGQTELNRDRLLDEIMINYPVSFDEQNAIVGTLESIDRKLIVNEQLNDNLQQQLTAIYKSWYQDFSLVNDTELVETAYGTIPKGWHYVLLGDLCQSISVTHKFDKNALIFLNTGDVEDGRFLHSNLMAVKEMPGQAKKTIAPGDILYSEIRPINRHFAYVNFPSDNYVVSTKLMVIRAKNFDTRRLYHYLTSENVLNELQLQAESRSGTFPQIRFENVSKLPILIADEQTESEFVKILHTVFDQIEQLNRENKQLSELRDTLLPKLMSGEIDVSDIQL